MSVTAIEVVKYEFKEHLTLKIVRVMPDEFETYKLTNHNGRDMTLVCAQNRFYENNPDAFIEYRNFYNASAGKFIIESDIICKDLANFIEQAYSAVDENRPFIITLNKKTRLVEKIVYPKVDPFSDSGLIQDLYLKPAVQVYVKPAPIKFENSKIKDKLNW
jgi:hypothetical protein